MTVNQAATRISYYLCRWKIVKKTNWDKEMCVKSTWLDHFSRKAAPRITFSKKNYLIHVMAYLKQVYPTHYHFNLGTKMDKIYFVNKHITHLYCIDFWRKLDEELRGSWIPVSTALIFSWHGPWGVYQISEIYQFSFGQSMWHK